jgi:hypothetical protein
VDLSFILLFQKIKGFAICNITKYALNDLCSDKKIPSPVIELLQKFTLMMIQGEEIDSDTLDSIKFLALCKNLSEYSHEMS